MDNSLDNLGRDAEHIMLAMLHTDPGKLWEMCDLLGVDPTDFAAFLKSDTKQHDH